MKRNLVIAINVILCFLNTCLLSRIKPTEKLCVIAVTIIRVSALPAYFYEMDDLADDAVGRLDIFMTSPKHEGFKGFTTEKPIQDEWQLRGEYRLQCLDQIAVGPKKVVRLLAYAEWDNNDMELKKWVLCVLNKLNLMSMEGVFKLDVAMSKLYNKDKEDAESLIDHCLPKTPMAGYEIAWIYVKCHNSVNANLAAISVF